MTQPELPGDTIVGINASYKSTSTILRIAKYSSVRLLALVFAVAVGVFASVILVNFGGFIDEIYRDQIHMTLMGIAQNMVGVSEEEKLAVIEPMREAMTESLGLNEPFLSRAFRWFKQALVFDWGEARSIQAYNVPFWQRHDIRLILLQRLPRTLFLFGTATLLLFFLSISFALLLSRKPGRWLEKIIVALTPISTAPSWIIAMMLVIVFSAVYPQLLEGDPNRMTTPIDSLLITLKLMLVPLLAILISLIFQNIYMWRSYFLLHNEEDYVELAKAQGLKPHTIDLRYIVRPTLPFIITSFTLMMITLWQGSIALEWFTQWNGIGSLLIRGIIRLERGVVMGIIVLFAYILAITVFLLDFVYAIVDPRVRISNEGRIVQVKARGSRWNPFLLRNPFKRSKWRPDSFQQKSPEQVTSYNLLERMQHWFLSTRLRLKQSPLREIRHHPPALLGLALLALLVIAGFYTVFAIPYEQAVMYWRPQQQGNYKIPQLAAPSWVNYFRKDKLPETIIQDTRNGTAGKSVVPASEEVSDISLNFSFDYKASEFPTDITLYLFAEYDIKRPLVRIVWQKPDGSEIDYGDFITPSAYVHRFSNATRELMEVKEGMYFEANHVLFGDETQEIPTPLAGTYNLRVEGITFEPGADIDGELVILGRVYGLMGSDFDQRDLTIPLMWGIPLALAFGLVGAVTTSLLSMIFAALSAWFGGWVDSLVQRLTEINLVLPTLAIAMTIYLLYSKSIWVILLVFVLLSIFGVGVKNYRAIFIQTREAPYIEAARAYGASNWRIISRYLVPRILPVLIPQLIILTPTFVFLEATLAYLGVQDPNFPSWGKVIINALNSEALQNGYYHWLLEPIGLLFLTGIAFALVGYSLDSILNPKLKLMD